MQQTQNDLAGFNNGTLDLVCVLNSLCELWNKTSKPAIEINQANPYATFKSLRAALTQKVLIDDVNFGKIDALIDDIAGNLNNKFKALNFSDANIAFNEDEFNYLSSDMNYLIHHIVVKPERNLNEDKITSLSFAGLISSVFEEQYAPLAALKLDDTHKATLAALLTSKAYVANKFLRQEDVSKAHFIKGAENVKRQIELYLKTSRGLQELYANTEPMVAALNLDYAEMKNKFCRAVICLEELNTMKHLKQSRISKASMMLAKRLHAINSYFEQVNIADNLSEGNQDTMMQSLVLYFNNISDINNRFYNINQYITEQIAQHSQVKLAKTALQVAGVNFARELAAEYS